MKTTIIEVIRDGNDCYVKMNGTLQEITGSTIAILKNYFEVITERGFTESEAEAMLLKMLTLKTSLNDVMGDEN